jgi:hypothetical protein
MEIDFRTRAYCMFLFHHFEFKLLYIRPRLYNNNRELHLFMSASKKCGLGEVVRKEVAARRLSRSKQHDRGDERDARTGKLREQKGLIDILTHLAERISHY